MNDNDDNTNHPTQRNKLSDLGAPAGDRPPRVEGDVEGTGRLVADSGTNTDPTAPPVLFRMDHKTVRSQGWPRRPRVACAGILYFQAAGSTPVSVDLRWNRWLRGDEQPYVRRLKVSHEPKPLSDKCWVEVASLVIIENHEGEGFQVIPTPEELDDVEARAVVLSVGSGDFLKVRPGESVFFEPTDFKVILVRSLHGTATITLTIYPE